MEHGARRNFGGALSKAKPAMRALCRVGTSWSQWPTGFKATLGQSTVPSTEGPSWTVTLGSFPAAAGFAPKRGSRAETLAAALAQLAKSVAPMGAAHSCVYAEQTSIGTRLQLRRLRPAAQSRASVHRPTHYPRTPGVRKHRRPHRLSFRVITRSSAYPRMWQGLRSPTQATQRL